MTASGYSPKKRIILFGPPGAGKGTFTEVLKKFLPDIVHISTGDIFRENLSKKTPLGLNAKEYMDKGILVPDAIVISMVKERLERDDVQDHGYILDGFPRTIEQARALTEITHADIFIHLSIDKEIVIKRILGRYSCPYCAKIYNKFFLPPKHEGICDECGSEIEFKQRSDDKEETIMKRLDVFEENARPIIEYYSNMGIMKVVDATRTLELNRDEIKELIELLILNICVPIKLTSSDLSQNEEIITNVTASNPEYIEFRLDYIDDTSKITPKLLEFLIKSVRVNDIKVIFTFRDKSEGGQKSIDINEHLRLITIMVNSRPDYIDIEMSADDEFIRESVSLALQNGIKIIFSYHDFEKTPSYVEARKVIDDFENRLVKELSIGAITIRDFPYKLIFKAQNFEDNLVPLRLCQEMADVRKRIISFCMGEAGIFSRVSCVKYGALLTFASLVDQTAPGQISIDKMREAHSILY
ncbi:MAG: type I 3-dehydroquinate dehydratase [Promethearchaeota archaeon]